MKNTFSIGDILKWVGPNGDYKPDNSVDYEVVGLDGEYVVLHHYGRFQANSFVLRRKKKPYNKKDWM